MKQLEKELAERFDLIIYDTPPLLGFTDAQVLAGREDGTIFVVHYGVDTKEEVMKASESLKMVNANVFVGRRLQLGTWGTNRAQLLLRL